MADQIVSFPIFKSFLLGASLCYILEAITKFFKDENHYKISYLVY